MSSVSSIRQYRVGVILFEGADILDFAAPIEILSHASRNRNPDDPDRIFNIETIARTRAISAKGPLAIQADVLLDDVFHNIGEYDILVVPGSSPSIVKTLIGSNSPELDLIRKFATLPLTAQGEPRVLFSVCTGAILLGAAGVLLGVTVTTHHKAFDWLRDVCFQGNEDRMPPPEIIHKRYVDGGLMRNGTVRLLTAGGVSCGLDASLFLVSQLTTPDMAAFVARVVEYDWKQPTE
ncbi:hypothetical protein ASPWEDRAFT_185315 [Aspergillus wentii DTO 134E9]|uniref:DJ-1/PfpI domain-containing protein n=1 Tax=Aspergillus wentii DTO 134E9 TaxID=1073089 RepID=A0A1L9RD24_ASPWE|nr:uncharacterized protein ASPWEDRAFT_185315 [Aspergillus wentii DTO 134E9]OJJ32849.1 hypothetical protein ASPWEDRAFT_185315 [Aspergillus wentii DTO 134E9]